jgi:hypothetical protein
LLCNRGDLQLLLSIDALPFGPHSGRFERLLLQFGLRSSRSVQCCEAWRGVTSSQEEAMTKTNLGLSALTLVAGLSLSGFSALGQSASDFNTPGPGGYYPPQRYYPQYQQPQYVNPRILRKQEEKRQRAIAKFGIDPYQQNGYRQRGYYQQPQQYYYQQQPRYYQGQPRYYQPQTQYYYSW